MNSSPVIGRKECLITPRILRGGVWSGAFITNPILRQHTRLLARMYRTDNQVALRLKEPCLRLIPVVESRTQLLQAVKRSRLNVIPVLVRLAAYHEHWIRDPDDWIPDGQAEPRVILESLISHLLNHYEVPKGSYQAWFLDGTLHQIERDWYCHLASGGDLRRFPGWVPLMTRKASHWFRTAPEELSMKRAIRWAQMMSISSDGALARRIMNTHAALDFANDKVWLRFFEMWVSSGSGKKCLSLVVDYLWAQLLDGKVDEFSLRRRTCSGLLRSAINYFQELDRTYLDDETCPSLLLGDESALRTSLVRYHRQCWDACDWVSSFDRVIGGWRWSMEELTNQDALLDEAKDMEHCVNTYSVDCMTGRSAIFSLRSCRVGEETLERDVTIELDPGCRRLVQVKAWQNRRSHALTRRVVMEWCRTNRIEPGAWSRW